MPSGTPSVSCALDIDLTIQTGSVQPPLNISWNIVQFSSNQQVVSSNGINYNSPNTKYQEEFCLPSNCYVFTMKAGSSDNNDTTDNNEVGVAGGRRGKFSLLVNDVPIQSNGGSLNPITFILLGGACQ